MSPPYFESGYPYGHDQFLSAQGSLWAVMALARALGPARKVELPPLKEAEPSNLPSWAETVLFGSVDDVKNLLAGGFDPNSATPAGTTALMMAAPDVVKMKLLIDHGANVNARARTQYSALMVACAIRRLRGRYSLSARSWRASSPFRRSEMRRCSTPIRSSWRPTRTTPRSLPICTRRAMTSTTPMVIIGTSSMTPLPARCVWGIWQ